MSEMELDIAENPVERATGHCYRLIVKIVFQSRKAESVSEGVGAVCMHFISLALSITGWIEQMVVALLEKQLTSRHKH